LNFFKEAALQDHPLQGEFPLLARMEGPAIVPAELMRTITTYRQACRLAWQLRRVRNMTFRQLAAEADLHYQHVTDYFHQDDMPRRRDLPAAKKDAVEAVLGNTAISQFLNRGARFTVLEELQANARAAA
jgi:hypothetical protein